MPATRPRKAWHRYIHRHQLYLTFTSTPQRSYLPIHPRHLSYTYLPTNTCMGMKNHVSTAGKDALVGDGIEMGEGESPSPLPVRVD